jgi:hypothetical protein
MTDASDLLARCRALGIALAPGPDGTLAWEAGADPPADLLADLARHKADVLALLVALAQPPCPKCARPLDRKGRCWSCCDRLCEQCGSLTGSAFLALCLCRDRPEAPRSG